MVKNEDLAKSLIEWLDNLMSGIWDIGDVLEHVFRANILASGMCRGLDLKEIVEFAYNEVSHCASLPTGDEPDFPHYCDQASEVIAQLQELSEKKMNEDVLYATECEKAINYLKEFPDELKGQPGHLSLAGHYRIVLEYWDDLRDQTSTYSMLMDLAAIQGGWRDDLEVKECLCDLVKTL